MCLIILFFNMYAELKKNISLQNIELFDKYKNAITTWRDTVPDSDSYQILPPIN